MNVVEHEQNTDAWMAWRRTRRQASYSPAVMRASTHQSPRDVVAFYRDGKTFAGNAATAYGHAHEAYARAYAARTLGEMLTPVCVEDGPYGASLDGLTFDEKVLTECKAPYRGQESPIWEQIARYHSAGGYAWQVQHQLMVTGCERALYVVWTPGAALHLWIEPDEAKQTELRNAWDMLWQDVLAGKPPERDDEAWRVAAQAYRSAKLRAERAAQELDAARDELVGITSGDCETGAGLRVQRIERKGAVDYAKVPELRGIDLEPYRKAPSSSWRVEEVSK